MELAITPGWFKHRPFLRAGSDVPLYVDTGIDIGFPLLSIRLDRPTCPLAWWPGCHAATAGPVLALFMLGLVALRPAGPVRGAAPHDQIRRT